MKVMIYMTMILAILIIAYKKLNNSKGYKIARLNFETELENQIIKTMVTFMEVTQKELLIFEIQPENPVFQTPVVERPALLFTTMFIFFIAESVLHYIIAA